LGGGEKEIIMPMQRHLYPKNWDAIATEIKEAANWQCVNCGRPCRKPSECIGDFSDRLHKDYPESEFNSELFDEVYDEETGEWGFIPRPQKFCLTVAHLNHEPSDCSKNNLRALCAPCHCRYDLQDMALKKRLKKERQGQLNFLA
jgi:hypothetical protein